MDTDVVVSFGAGNIDACCRAMAKNSVRKVTTMNRYLRSALLGLALGHRRRLCHLGGGFSAPIGVPRGGSEGSRSKLWTAPRWAIWSQRWCAVRSQSGIETIGTAVDAVDLTGIEEMIARNGFVDEVAAYVSYDGFCMLAISQRSPLLRLLVNGLNAYVTAEGDRLSPRRGHRRSTFRVVTGSYRPPFRRRMRGSVGACRRRSRKWTNGSRNSSGRSIPFTAANWQNDRNLSALRRMRVKKQWWRLESSAEYDKRVGELRRHKVEMRRKYRYEARMIQEGIDRIARQQEAERLKQKKLEKSYEDFMKLLTFVEFVEEDDFWRSEVVQIAARTTPSGALEVELVPRSGRHTILFGRIEQVERKFDKLLRFYRNGFPSIGWNEYRTIRHQI